MHRWSAVLLFAIAGAAHAQDQGFDAHGFYLAPLEADPASGLMVQRVGLHDAGDFYVGGVFEYAESPLVGTDANGDRVAIVDDLVALNAGLGVSLHERIRLEVGAPVYLSVTGQDGPGGGAMGDLRFGATGTLLQPGPVGIGIRPWLDVPIGPDERFLGQGKIAGGVAAVLTAEIETVTLTADLGPQFNPALELSNLTGSDSLMVGLGANVLASADVGIGAEVRGSAPFTAAGESGTGAPWEGLLYGRFVQSGGGHMLGGVGTGLSPGVGAAVFRGFIGGGFGSRPSPPEAVVDTSPIEPDEVEQPPEDTGEVVQEAPPPIDPNAPRVSLVVRATFRGNPLRGSEVVLDGPEPQTVETPTQVLVPEDSLWKAVATKGECMEGDGFVQVHDKPAVLDIPLQYLPGANLKIVVMDQNGKPLPDATIEIVSRDEHCAPPDPLEIGPDGIARSEIGKGTHRVTVSAKGHVAHEESFSLQDGDTREVIALLAPEG